MTPELAARKFQFREGFHLVDYGEVGLPIFRLTLEAITMSPRFMPTIQEFALRCLDLGETHEVDVANMLGLKLDVVVSAMNVLISDGSSCANPTATVPTNSISPTPERRGCLSIGWTSPRKRWWSSITTACVECLCV